VLHHQLETWQQPEYAREWAQGDALSALLDLPRKLAAAIVADAGRPVRTIVDIASGPGAFLEALLTEFPDARGIWTDGSGAMEEQARERLAPFGDRVEFRIVDMTALDAAGLPEVDVLLSSRATHHLEPVELRRFYRAAAALVVSGGWVANLDHTDQPWKERYQRVLKRFTGARPAGSGHVHTHASPCLEDHLECMRDAGLDADLVWKAGRTVLVQGQIP
jgi:trans-aconitate methyltransferase